MNKQAFFLAVFLVCLLIAIPATGLRAQAAEDYSWEGTWIAEGSFFSVAVTVSENRFVVAAVESLGFEWSTEAGTVVGQQAAIEVSYAGATALILVQLIDANIAVASAASCLPEYLVVCALAQNRQARFVRVEPISAQ
ncbi:MAG: hypothetical protein WD772_06965 [Pseudohongiellaceae bacterium]